MAGRVVRLVIYCPALARQGDIAIGQRGYIVGLDAARIRTWLALPFGVLGAMALFGSAHADPCKAIPDQGPAPSWLKPGTTISGPVTYIVDGDGLCVAAIPGRERDPATWVEIRVADFYAVELNDPGGQAEKAALERLVAGKTVSCKIQKQSYDRAVAACTIGGRSVGQLLRAQGVSEGGRAYPAR